jgi:hypothetical protein
MISEEEHRKQHKRSAMSMQEGLYSRLKGQFLQTTRAHGLPGSWLAGSQSQQCPACSGALLCSPGYWHMCGVLAALVMSHTAGCLQHCSPGSSKAASVHSSKSTSTFPGHEPQKDHRMVSARA